MPQSDHSTGQELTDEQEVSDAQAVDIRRSAMDFLARREHSALELERKLSRRYSREPIRRAIERLVDEGLQSDERFAENFLRQRADRGYGPLRIQRELQERGVADALAERILQDSAIDWPQVAARALGKKFGTVAATSLSLAEKARILRFAAYRGFCREHLPPRLR